jgi:hypothetical protein
MSLILFLDFLAAAEVLVLLASLGALRARFTGESVSSLRCPRLYESCVQSEKMGPR